MSFFIGGIGSAATNLVKNHFSTNDDLVKVCSHDGNFLVISRGDKQIDTVIVGDNEGLLLGNIFDKNVYNSVDSFEKVVNPGTLMNNYWGRYSGALYNPETKMLSLVRDPLGLEALFYMPYKDGMIFSSSLPKLYDVLLQKPEIDWHYFAEFLLEKNYLIPETPFKNVCELLPGICLTYNDGSITQEFLWKIPTKSTTNDKEIEGTLLNTLIKSTKAWTKKHEKISLQLSGGVDSSSILCLLKECAPNADIQGIHYNDTKNVASQEIEYAQQISKDCNTPLLHIDFQDARLFDPLPQTWRPDKPSTGMVTHSSVKKLMEYTGDGLLFSGQGGDHVFLAPPPQESIADYWLEKGLRGISNVVHEIGSIYRTSWPALAKTTFKTLHNYYFGKEIRMQEFNLDHEMLTKNYTDNVQKKSFYLDKHLKQFKPAKALHIKLLYHAVAYSDSIKEAHVIYPLLSMPVVECGLRIPTYQSIKNGYNRYYFRKAVSRINPTKVIWRLNKGEVSASLVKALKKELEPLIALVENGLLLKNNVIDRVWFENRVERIRHGDAKDLLPLFRIIGAERWFKQWKLN